MFNNKTLSRRNLKSFDLSETKKNVITYFMNLEKLELELAKITTQKGLTANYDFATQYKKQPYIPIGKDEFNLSTKENKEKQIKNYISSYYWAKGFLTDNEQIYIEECFINGKHEREFVDLLGFDNTDSHAFRKLKRSAIYKFADFLDLLVEVEKIENC